MANVYTSANQLIGRTPLFELVHIEKEIGLSARTLAKLELFNVTGSAKDRIARAMTENVGAIFCVTNSLQPNVKLLV